MEFWKVSKKRGEKKYLVSGRYRGPSTIALLFISIALFSWIIAFGISVTPIALWLYNTARPTTATMLAESLRDIKLDYSKALVVRATPAPSGEPVATPTAIIPTPDEFLPPQDSSLPPFPTIRIPAIEVETGIWEARYEEFEDALRRGVWRVPEFGDPTTSKTSPMILSAHRYGYLEWTHDFRLKNSFYNLPKLKEGDEIEIFWDMRPFKYRVVKLGEEKEITDYSYPLIMYTCKYLVSEERIIVYAERVKSEE